MVIFSMVGVRSRAACKGDCYVVPGTYYEVLCINSNMVVYFLCPISLGRYGREIVRV